MQKSYLLVIPIILENRFNKQYIFILLKFLQRFGTFFFQDIIVNTLIRVLSYTASAYSNMSSFFLNPFVDSLSDYFEVHVKDAVAEEEPKKTGGNRCFNCLGDHMIAECPQPRNPKEINRNKREHQLKMASFNTARLVITRLITFKHG